ncbi:hypothetical protein ACH47Z_42340 [Streptomyces sp. NPDC020192]|uniref:hypothetical protein n=1 Tax=Streptomyces sp. NPDC020192 TaxID=3365066 RepID=UPI00379078E6
MKSVLGRAANTVNAHLIALDRFFTQLGLGPAVVRRDDASKLAPRSLVLVVMPAILRGRPCGRVNCFGHMTSHS